jgi:hypothetical protein
LPSSIIIIIIIMPGPFLTRYRFFRGQLWNQQQETPIEESNHHLEEDPSLQHELNHHHDFVVVLVDPQQLLFRERRNSEATEDTENTTVTTSIEQQEDHDREDSCCLQPQESNHQQEEAPIVEDSSVPQESNPCVVVVLDEEEDNCPLQMKTTTTGTEGEEKESTTVSILTSPWPMMGIANLDEQEVETTALLQKKRDCVTNNETANLANNNPKMKTVLPKTRKIPPQQRTLSQLEVGAPEEAPAFVLLPSLATCHNGDFPRALYHHPTLRPPVALYSLDDNKLLTPYECLIRKQLEFFQADPLDVQECFQAANTASLLGNNNAIMEPKQGQVGIRCCHCAHIHPHNTVRRGAMQFPRHPEGIVTSAFQLAQTHLLQACPYVSTTLREELKRLQYQQQQQQQQQAACCCPSTTKYWAGIAQENGIFSGGELYWNIKPHQDGNRLRKRHLPKQYYNYKVGGRRPSPTTAPILWSKSILK